MKLVRYGPRGSEQAGLVDAEGRIRSLAGLLPEIDAGAIASGRLAALAAKDPSSLPLVEGPVRLGPPLAGVGKVVAAGLNYAEHAREAGLQLPAEPIFFMKAVTAISGPNDPVIIPPGATKVDWEVELAFVIGRTARYVREQDAMAHVLGYTILNDVSERAFQLERGTQWVKGKSCDTFAPIGPWLVTADEIRDPHDLGLWLEVNGHRYQSSRTSDMVFRIPALLSTISRYMTLVPGDIVATGTPAGVGTGLKPPVYLRPGDVMMLGIDGLGVQRQQVVAYNPADAGEGV
jgi:2,4-diketo-3-deoxy-L-fuconate hydrolase